MTAPLFRDCPLCGERHELYEYTADDLMEAITILDSRILGNSDPDSLPVSPHPGFEDTELRPVAELLGLVLRKLLACPVCGHDPGPADDEPESLCACECHEEADPDEGEEDEQPH